MPTRAIHAHLDPRLSATLVSRRPLLYADGADDEIDRPAHVRSASGLVWCGDRLAVVQDDAAFIALLDPRDGAVEGISLPARDGQRLHDKRRGNKHRKYDLESALAWDGGLLLFGSGSTEARQTLIRVDTAGQVELFDASELYGALRGWRDFSGPELNVEGVARLGDHLLLMQRGNGAPVAGESRVDAICRVSWSAFLAWLAGAGPCPQPGHLQRFELGLLDGVRLTFTDGEAVGDTLFYLAAAEDSPDAVDDGPVTGVVLGRFDGEQARFAPILDAEGETLREKGEGLTIHPADPSRAYVVTDADDPDRPAELLEIRLTGPW